MPRLHLSTVVAFLFVSPLCAGDVEQAIPSDAEFVLHCDAKALAASALGQKLLPRLVETPVPGEFLKAIQLDPRKDIESVTLVGKPSFKKQQLTVLVRGSFNLKQIDTVARQLVEKKDAALRIHAGKRTIYEIAARNPWFASFPDALTLVLGTSSDLVTQALDRLAARPAEPAAELKTLLARADRKQTVWIAGRFSADFKKELSGRDKTVNGVVDSLETVAGGATVA